MDEDEDGLVWDGIGRGMDDVDGIDGGMGMDVD
jgi:hypothetical protein